MTQQVQDLRDQTLERVLAGIDQPAPATESLIRAWLNSLEEEDLAGITFDCLASSLWEGFSRLAQWTPQEGCRIETLTYADDRGVRATALLILNPDMPFLVDSMVMAMRRMRLPSRAVLNAVLSVERNGDGSIVRAGKVGNGAGAPESYVLCLMAEELAAQDLQALQSNIRMAAGDAAVVRQDAEALKAKMSEVGAAAAARDANGPEVAAFLEWARNEGFEVFGYARYHVVSGQRELVREPGSAIGVLKDKSHPVYGNCLAGIPGDFDTLAARKETLSVVKADVQSTLHRDQQLDFIGVRDADSQGSVLGEHCFVGLFSRSATASTLPQQPFARVRIKQVLTLAGVRTEGFRAEKFLEILESLPRTEVMEADPAWLAGVCGAVVALYKQPRAKVFARRDVYGRHLNALVYMPRERYGTHSQEMLAQTLRTISGARDVRVQTLLADGPLARVYLIANGANMALDLDGDIQQPLLGVLEGWHNAFDSLVDTTDDIELRRTLRKLRASLPTDYINGVSPQVGYRDLCTLLGNPQPSRVKVRIEIGASDVVTIRLHSVNTVPPLSSILPALQNAGVSILRERTHAIPAPDGSRFFVSSLSVDAQSAVKLAKPHVAQAAQELFESLFNDEAEDGRMNALVVEAGLRMREVQLVRAYASYWRQAGCRFSLRYMAERLKTQPDHVRTLVEAFLVRFNPSLSAEQRAFGTTTLSTFKQRVTDVNHADTENILRAIADLMLATLRTSYFQAGQAGDTIIFKFDSSQLALLPQPRPYREIFVFSRRFEGVHLRGGPVARGGLRWSDRMEDYRTEVLGLVKAQMVKNAVIVPAGAKGGFVCKMMPKDATREVAAAEGEAVYRLFIAGLLDVTDNRVRGEVLPPPQTVCYDDADPYLVVAADKGTATFSDIANSIAVKRGFWLGDAFASGGSNGYDHKKLGITAKGAWEAVKRHFHEMGHDLNTTPITAVGVGDMSGDVFGNGMLLSRQLKLVAAFDHRHIFIDPNPDVEKSFYERQRMFALPRSSWDDYDKALISEGGGVWLRSARSIELSPQARAALGIEASSLAPEELLHAILLAPVDLFYNGGIGTYIKASTESHEQVKDRANDAIRVDGRELRCRVVAEGGNLGATQAGRIEFAMKGGRIFTDAIDNSAGVDCSDHEVNVKIWLDAEVNAGKLAAEERNRLLNDITPDIVRLVLRDNALQTHLLVREAQAQFDPAVHDSYAALIARLEAEGVVSRKLEQLPTAAELVARKNEGRGLTTPELAVVVANVKNRYKRMLSELNLVQFAWARSMLTPYFPHALVATRNPLEHPLANAILATVLANESVNRCGPVMMAEIAETRGVKETDVICAWAQAWAALNLAPVFSVLDEHALQVPREVSLAVDQHARTLQKAVIQGVLSVPEQELRESGALAELTALFGQPQAVQDLAPLASASLPVAGMPESFVQACETVEAIEGIADFLFAGLSVPRPDSMSLTQFLKLGMALRRQAGIDGLERVLTHAPASATQEPLRDHALQALRRAQQRLLMRVLQQAPAAIKAAQDPAGIVAALINKLKVDARMAATGEQQNLELAVLDVWALSEAASSTTEPV
ncbi:NAD-glutamate dehydrogenase domain-containing protein [Noviherbaspirillum sp.]|uniref:NAD-glutamate dehydrogenase domain-containing protein n=1 Tax=Noviherbaspirillum sp. TaxID=1926288 RepID=UPI002D61BEE9|nr:NAD-glutamate dehydrogenase domain-containing protein [Noviherbaspirillum sp.]HZW20638.1 NAD-glutamate dehydrogenase domain-containing protein [Noviherbaspirillum sp.]